MILFHGDRVACENCIRGHRAADCSHLCKFLISIKSRGRPITQKTEDTIRFRIHPGVQAVKVTFEKVDNRNKRSTPDTKKECFHLHDMTPVELFKVRPGKFKVLGPVLLSDPEYQGYVESFGEKFNIVPPTCCEEYLEDTSASNSGPSAAPTTNGGESKKENDSEASGKTEKSSQVRKYSSDAFDLFSRSNSTSTDATDESINNVLGINLPNGRGNTGSAVHLTQSIFDYNKNLESYRNRPAQSTARSRMHATFNSRFDSAETPVYRNNFSLDILASAENTTTNTGDQYYFNLIEPLLTYSNNLTFPYATTVSDIIREQEEELSETSTVIEPSTRRDEESREPVIPYGNLGDRASGLGDGIPHFDTSDGGAPMPQSAQRGTDFIQWDQPESEL